MTGSRRVATTFKISNLPFIQISRNTKIKIIHFNYWQWTYSHCAARVRIKEYRSNLLVAVSSWFRTLRFYICCLLWRLRWFTVNWCLWLSDLWRIGIRRFQLVRLSLVLTASCGVWRHVVSTWRHWSTAPAVKHATCHCTVCVSRLKTLTHSKPLSSWLLTLSTSFLFCFFKLKELNCLRSVSWTLSAHCDF